MPASPLCARGSEGTAAPHGGSYVPATRLALLGQHVNTPHVASTLVTILARRDAGAGEWLGRVIGEPEGASERGAFRTAFVSATRRLGNGDLRLSAEEERELASALNSRALPRRWWSADELGRAALLAWAAARLPGGPGERLVADCYGRGDNRERQAVLRALLLLPDPGRFLPLAVDACRSHVQPVFEAIACENAYPAEYFPELNFNQMVLKALFIGVRLHRIIGVDERGNPELARMAEDYASERRAAGRSIPDDIGLVTQAQRSWP